MVVFQVFIGKNCIAKILLAISETFLCENSCNDNSYKFSNKFSFVAFLHFPRNQKQESSIAQVGHLITKNIYVFVNGELRSTLNLCWVRYILGSNLLTCYFCSYYSFIFRICNETFESIYFKSQRVLAFELVWAGNWKLSY